MALTKENVNVVMSSILFGVVLVSIFVVIGVCSWMANKSGIEQGRGSMCSEICVANGSSSGGTIVDGKCFCRIGDDDVVGLTPPRQENP